LRNQTVRGGLGELGAEHHQQREDVKACEISVLHRERAGYKALEV